MKKKDLTLIEIYQNIQRRAVQKDQKNEYGGFSYYNINQLKALVNAEFDGTKYFSRLESKYERVAINTLTHIANDNGEHLETREEKNYEYNKYIQITVRNEENVIVDASGWVLIKETDLAKQSYYQTIGSGESYVGKYLYSSFFGLSTDAIDPDELKQEQEKQQKELDELFVQATDSGLKDFADKIANFKGSATELKTLKNQLKVKLKQKK